MAQFPVVVIFGGAGFIGSHLTRFLIENDFSETIFVVDIEPLRTELLTDSVIEKVRYLVHDLRQPIPLKGLLPEQCDLIFNLAAVHREPGHKPHEYYETNIRGAEHVCQWADQVGCSRLVFTSSISPYGPWEHVKNETTTPIPTTPYGSSKLVAEKIHETWHAKRDGRELVIVRPGVVFGPGENGNVTRMVKALKKRYFFYAGNRKLVKAGGYVKELCHSMLWALNQAVNLPENRVLYNFTISPNPMLQDYVQAICRVNQMHRRVLNVPPLLLMSVAYFLRWSARITGLTTPVDPVRIIKLTRPNHIEPAILSNASYPYHFSLEESMQDWKREMPMEW